MCVYNLSLFCFLVFINELYCFYIWARAHAVCVCSPVKVLTWTCALETMVIVTTYRGNTPVYFMMRWEHLQVLCCFYILPVPHMQYCNRCALPVLCRTPSITSCSTTVSTAPPWTTSSTPVISLRRPRRLHPAAWWQKSKASSVSLRHWKHCSLPASSPSHTLPLLVFTCKLWSGYIV